MQRDYKVLTVRVPLPVFRRFKRYLADRDRSAQEQLLNWIDHLTRPGGGTQYAADPFEGGLRDTNVVELMEEDRRQELSRDARWQSK